MAASTSSLSICMTASGPATRVRAILEALRPIADEIVLGVDMAGDPRLRDLGKDLVDVLLPFESPGFGGGLIGWIQHQCSSAWILRLDDDEMPSAGLLDRLLDLSANPAITHALMPRRWLFPDARSYLCSHPWSPDYQLRLVRNVPGIWRFGGQVHDGPSVYGSHRLLEEPIYHADCLLQSLEQRRAKAMRYERARPGHRSEGFPVNAMYVPEVCEGMRSRSVPEEDLGLVLQLIDDSVAPWRPRLRRRAWSVTRKEDIVRFNTKRSVSSDAYRAFLTVSAPRSQLPINTDCSLDVLVRNLGDERWPPAHVNEPAIRLGCRWRESASALPIGGEGRSPFPAPVDPGEESRVRLSFRTPNHAGSYVLEIDVVHEGVRWFGAGTQMDVTLVSAQDLEVRPIPAQFLQSYGLDGIDLRLVEVIRPKDGGVFIEAGANDGLTQSNTALLERSFGWHGLLVEPVPRLADLCRSNRPGAIVEEAALVPFGYAEDSVCMTDCGLMSLVDGAMGGAEADADHLRRGSELQGRMVVAKMDVPAASLSELIDRHGLGPVDLLVLDVEGYEAPALRGLDMARHAPEFLLIEVRFRPEVEKALRGLYAPIAQLSHHDVLYRRRG